MNPKVKNIYKIKTEKKNKIVVEEVNPNELKEIWEKLHELNKAL
jgi:restriction endonuclease